MHTLTKNFIITQSVLFVLIFLACTIFPKPVYAVATSLPSIDVSTVLTNYTATIATVTGADHNGGADGQGNILNDATITLAGSTAITINNGGTLVAKSITFPVGTTASISLQSTSATILPNDTTPIYVTDTDSDGYTTSFSTMTTTSGTGKRRLFNMTSTSQIDCLDSVAVADAGYVYTSATCYPDVDSDTFGSTVEETCIGKTDHSAVTCATATHAYAAGAGVTAGPFVTNNTDCLDSVAVARAGYVYTSATCYVDADNDNYGSNTSKTCIGNVAHSAVTCATATYAYAAGVGVNATAANFDADNYDCDDNDNTMYPGRPCNAGVDCTACHATARTCTAAVAAGDNGLPACKRCNGVSTSPVNYSNDSQDDTGYTCVATCKKCYNGSCINQTNTQDLFGDCAGTTAVNVRLNEVATVTCNALCASNSHQDANCSGTSAACGSVAESCVDVGTDDPGTNNVGAISQGGICAGTAVTCSTVPAGGNIICLTHITPWTNCRCTYDSR